MRAWALVAGLLAMATAADASVRRVVLVGDSITWGVVSGAGGPPYAERLAAELGPLYDVVNAGCGGASSLDWTLSQPGAVCGGVGIVEPGLYEARARPHLPADVATLLVGTNDAVGFFEPEPVDVASYGAAVNEIVWNLLTDGADVVILMTAPDHAWDDPDAVARLAGYRDEILALCADHSRVVCGPDLHQELDLALHFEADDVHPNAAGHEAIADALAPVVRDQAPHPRCGVGPELTLLLPLLMAWRRRPAAGA